MWIVQKKTSCCEVTNVTGLPSRCWKVWHWLWRRSTKKADWTPISSTWNQSTWKMKAKAPPLLRSSLPCSICFLKKPIKWREQEFRYTSAMQSQFVKTNSINLHVMTDGPENGTPVILLHGFPEFSYGWRKQVPALVEAGGGSCTSPSAWSFCWCCSRRSCPAIFLADKYLQWHLKETGLNGPASFLFGFFLKAKV